jgi:glycosyltransferase involved in cell wall biosynthesis
VERRLTARQPPHDHHQRERLLVVAQLPPPLHGAAAANKAVVQSTVINGHFHIDVVPIDVARQLTELRTFSAIKLLRSIAIVAKVVGHLLRRRYAVAYLTMAPTGYAFYRDSCCVLAFRLLRVPHVLHFHGRGMRKFENSSWAAAYCRFILKRASIVHLSPLLFPDIQPFVRHAQVSYVANGVEEPAVTRRESARPPSILFMGSMLESKGPLVLLEALRRMKLRGIAFRARFAGSWRGGLQAGVFASKVAEFDLENEVEHLGVIQGERKSEVLSSSDIFAFPTNYENEAFPLVVLEAMATGLVPVTSDIAALPAIVGDCGLLVPPEDAEALAGALAGLIAAPETLKSLKARARKKYLGAYTMAHFENALLAVLVAAAAGETAPAKEVPA